MILMHGSAIIEAPKIDISDEDPKQCRTRSKRIGRAQTCPIMFIIGSYCFSVSTLNRTCFSKPFRRYLRYLIVKPKLSSN